MQNLVIGNTSQIARYFPNSFIQISSRNIDENFLTNIEWNNVHICFAEQRTFLANDKSLEKLFFDTNVVLVKDIISKIKAKKIFYYSTAELWNNLSGEVNIKTPFNYYKNNYTESKHEITVELLDKKKYHNVSVVFPFNFNSVYRKKGYLFSKIFDSIVNKEKITIGDTHYYRDIIHPKMLVDFVLTHDIIGEDFIVGSGVLTNVNDFIKKLYLKMNMNYDEYITEKIDSPSIYRNKIFYSSLRIEKHSEKNLLKYTINEIKERINDNS